MNTIQFVMFCILAVALGIVLLGAVTDIFDI